MIIEAGILSSGTKVYSISNKEIHGVLNKDGSITLKIKEQTRNFPYPSGAARAIENLSINGWKYWTILDSNEYKDLVYFRDVFIKTNRR